MIIFKTRDFDRKINYYVDELPDHNKYTEILGQSIINVHLPWHVTPNYCELEDIYDMGEIL